MALKVTAIRSKVKSRGVSMSKDTRNQGRLDNLLIGVASRLGTELENRLNLPGLAGALEPLAKKEIGRLVPRGNVIPEEFRGLAKLVGKHVIQQ